jgi:hypothetical protein
MAGGADHDGVMTMRNELLAAFENQVAELKERLPSLKGDSRRQAMAQLESMNEFLELIDLIGGRRIRPTSSGETSAPTA